MSRPENLNRFGSKSRGARKPRSSSSDTISRTRRLGLEVLEDRRVLAAVTVTNDLDAVNGNTSSVGALVGNDGGDGVSLREAIVATNNTVGADEITFDAALSGQTITLGGTQIRIEDTLTIDATALPANVIVDANELSRIFELNTLGTATEDFDATLAGLTLTGGKTNVNLARGGAILGLTSGTLFLEQTTVSGNQTEGTRSGGGAIRVGADVVLTDSTVSGNSTLGDFSRGGAIEAIGSVTLMQSTLSGNSTQGQNAEGGGIRATGAVTVTQSTLTANQATYATATGGAIWNNNAIIITNSIIAGNSAGGGNADLRPGSGTLTVNHSLIGDTSGLSPQNLADLNAGTGNVFDVLAPVDPLLDTLADNGGPTPTHALLPGSPAIDVGGTTALTFDQRGTPFTRVVGPAVDMGAYEVQIFVPSPYVVTTTTDELDFSNNDVSLREAITSANQEAGANTITFSNLFNTPQAINLDSQLPTIIEELSIVGPGQDLLTIDAGDGDDDAFATGDGYRHFDINDGDSENEIDVTLSGLLLTGGDTSNGLDGTEGMDGGNGAAGGAIRSLENLFILNSTLIGNATGDGGDGDATSSGGNGGNGGALSVSGELTLIDSTIKDNLTGSGGAGGSEDGVGGPGGGILALAQATISGSTISGNMTGPGGSGGGVSITGGGSITNSTISGNSIGASAVGGGGGIFAVSSVSIESSTIWGNSSNLIGGGIRSSDTFVISNSIVAGNSAISGNSDIFPVGSPMLLIDYSLISDTSGLSTQELTDLEARTGNLLDVDPQLDALADNGGTTETHALLANSPAINTGDPGIAFNENEFDQRGAPFARVVGNRIDMGAFESATIPPAPSADFDGDNDVDGADFLAWQRGLGTPDAEPINGDADNDDDVDSDDLGFWQQQFGQTVMPPAVSATVIQTPNKFAILQLQWPTARDADVDLLFSVEGNSSQDSERISLASIATQPVLPGSDHQQDADDLAGVDQFFASKGDESSADEGLAIAWNRFK